MSAVLVWPDGGKGRRQALSGPGDTVMDLAAWGDGLAFGAGDPALGLLGADGKRVLLRGPPMADLRGKVREHFLVSADGRRARFGLAALQRRSRGSSISPDLTLGPSHRSRQTSAKPTSPPSRSTAGRMEHTEAQDQGLGRHAQVPLGLRPYETARSLAIAPDAQSFVLGTDWSLRRFDKDGKPLWEKPAPGVAWGVNLAREGRLILAAYGDGTIRWHRAADGAELLALFIHVPDDPKAEKRWVLWTPEGYYAASPGGEDLIGWHVNRGLDQAADFYPAETFRSTFHRPDLVQAALDKV